MKSQKPSFVFNYWRPWNENSNLFESYLDYKKDTSLVKYAADTIGKYASQASSEQIKVINRLGYTLDAGINQVSNQISEANQSIQLGNT